MMFKYMCLVLFITWFQLAECHPASSNLKAMDSMIEKESEAFLSVEAEDSSHKNVRDKRTIGFLRQLFPNLSQIVDRKIQQITRFVFRVIGRLVLRGGGAGAGAGGAAATGGTGGESGSNGGRRISITLPTFPPSTDDEEEDTATVLPTADTSSSPAAPSSDADQLASRIAGPASSEVTATDSAPAASADSAAAADSASEVAITTAEPASTTAPVTTSAPVTSAAAITTTAAEAAPVTNAAPSAGSVSTTTVAAAAAAAATATANAISSPTTQMPLDSDNTVGTGIVKRTVREVSTNEPSSTKKRSPLTDTGKI